MAKTSNAAALRGAKLIKKALTSAAAVIPAPEPLVGAKKLKLPNGEPLSPAMKELLTFDGSFLAIDYDDEEFEIEAAALEDIIEEHLGEAAVPAFAEATELLSEDLVAFGCDRVRPACLYVGEVDDAGEYPVLELSYEDGVARIGGFVPFDVWMAQELGGLERGKDIGDVPAEYAELPKAAAEANGDGRVVFTPQAGVADADEDEDE
jgi:hypothetical protein